MPGEGFEPSTSACPRFEARARLADMGAAVTAAAPNL